jgi:hypothetical protein
MESLCLRLIASPEFEGLHNKARKRKTTLNSPILFYFLRALRKERGLSPSGDLSIDRNLSAIASLSLASAVLAALRSLVATFIRASLCQRQLGYPRLRPSCAVVPLWASRNSPRKTCAMLSPQLCLSLPRSLRACPSPGWASE